MDLQLKFEMLNAFNRHQFGLPSVNPTDNLFGVPTSTLTTARNSQLPRASASNNPAPEPRESSPLRSNGPSSTHEPLSEKHIHA